MILRLFGILLIWAQAFLVCAQTSNVMTFRAGGPTVARGINNRGEVVGYVTPTGTTTARGFIRTASGAIETVLLPGASETRFHGINDQGETVGINDNTRAFVRTVGGVVTEITVPGAASVSANGINNNGYIVGSYLPVSSTVDRAFLRNLAGEIVRLGDNYAGDMVGTAISNSGNRIALTENDSTVYLSDANGNFPRYVVPAPGPYLRSARGLNASDTLLGTTYGDTALLIRNNVDPIHFSIPGFLTTFPFGINDRHQITGAVIDYDNRQFGFLMDPCSPILPTASRAHGSAAETGGIELQGEGLCVWFAQANAPWITLQRSIGSGFEPLKYTLTPNTGAEREGLVTIGTRQFRITQASGACSYSIAPGFASIEPTGGQFTLNINTSAGCAWTISTSEPWIHIPSVAGVGSTQIAVTVDPLPSFNSASRSSSLNIAGIPFSVSQSGLPCDLQVSRSAITVAAEGGIENVRVTVRTGCSWFLQIPERSFVSLVQGSTPLQSVTSFQGSATLSLLVARNIGTTARNATLNILGFPNFPTITINQLGAAACSYTLSRESATIPAEGSVEFLGVTAGTNCALTAVSEVPWITVAVPPNSSGSIQFRVAPNLTRLARRGVVRLGNAQFTVDQLANLQVGLGFVPIDSCRLMDTRMAQAGSVLGGPTLLAGRTRTISAAGVCSIPHSARAYVLNVTAYPIRGLGFVTLYPDNQARPTASTLNSFDGRVVSNLAVIPAGSVPTSVTVYASDTTDLVVDAIGYFADPGPDSLVLYPLPPCRAVDTRETNAPLAAGVSRDVAMNGRCGVPANAAAVSVNLTAVPRGALDSLTLWSGGRPRPLASTLNAPSGQITANGALLATGANGALSIQASQATDFILDVNGYFGPPSDTGLYFNPVTPCRIADTRQNFGGPILASSVVRTIVPAATSCGIPLSARAHLVNATVVPPGPLAFLSLFPSPNWPGNSTLNAFSGQVTANLAIVPDTGLGIGAFASSPTHLVLDVSGYFATLPADQRRPSMIP